MNVRRATNLSIDPDLVEEAKALGINASRAAEAGLREAVRAARAEAWLRENAEAIASWNAWVEEHGLPLAKYRRF
jgi:antitoxin CcdA